MSDRAKLAAALKAAAWAYAAEHGSRAAQDALDAVKQEIANADWSQMTMTAMLKFTRRDG